MASSSNPQGSNPAISTSTTPFPTSLTNSSMPRPPAPVAPYTGPVPAPDGASASTSSGRRTKGRGKIEMKKMEKESNMLVTFSKRKSNLLKKANELCTLCGAECAVVVFSPAGKVFSYGHPSVDRVIDRYLNGSLDPNPPPPPAAANPMPQNPRESGQRQAGADIVQTLSAELSRLTSLLEAAKKHGQALDERRAARTATRWWERPVGDLDDVAQLDALRDAMLDLRGKVYTQAALRMQASGYNGYPGAGPSTGGFPGGNYHDGPGKAADPSC